MVKIPYWMHWVDEFGVTFSTDFSRTLWVNAAKSAGPEFGGTWKFSRFQLVM